MAIGHGDAVRFSASERFGVRELREAGKRVSSRLEVHWKWGASVVEKKRLCKSLEGDPEQRQGRIMAWPNS